MEKISKFTLREGYIAVYVYLDNLNQVIENDDLYFYMGGMETLPNDLPLDIARWECDWKNAVERVHKKPVTEDTVLTEEETFLAMGAYVRILHEIGGCEDVFLTVLLAGMPSLNEPTQTSPLWADFKKILTAINTKKITPKDIRYLFVCQKKPFLTIETSYIATLVYLDHLWQKTQSTDIDYYIREMRFVAGGTVENPIMWHHWEKTVKSLKNTFCFRLKSWFVKPKIQLTSQEGYHAMVAYFEHLYGLCPTKFLALFLSGLRLEKGMCPIDKYMWQDWENAVDRVLFEKVTRVEVENWVLSNSKKNRQKNPVTHPPCMVD